MCGPHTVWGRRCAIFFFVARSLSLFLSLLPFSPIRLYIHILANARALASDEWGRNYSAGIARMPKLMKCDTLMPRTVLVVFFLSSLAFSFQKNVHFYWQHFHMVFECRRTRLPTFPTLGSLILHTRFVFDSIAVCHCKKQKHRWNDGDGGGLSSKRYAVMKLFHSSEFDSLESFLRFSHLSQGARWRVAMNHKVRTRTNAQSLCVHWADICA